MIFEPLEVSLNMGRKLSGREIGKMEEDFTNLFGGRKECYVEINQVNGFEYKLCVRR